jgi:hypothetical protein
MIPFMTAAPSSSTYQQPVKLIAQFRQIHRLCQQSVHGGSPTSGRKILIHVISKRNDRDAGYPRIR